MAWFEVTGPDAKVLQSFYSQAFDWQIDADNSMNYAMVAAGEGGICCGRTSIPERIPFPAG